MSDGVTDFPSPQHGQARVGGLAGEAVDRGEAVQAALDREQSRPGAAIVNEREATHGAFADTARAWYRLSSVVAEERARCGTHAGDLEPVVAYGLDQDIAKIARIVSGDPTFLDHWEDVAGYAEGVATEIRKQAREEG